MKFVYVREQEFFKILTTYPQGLKQAWNINQVELSGRTLKFGEMSAEMPDNLKRREAQRRRMGVPRSQLENHHFA